MTLYLTIFKFLYQLMPAPSVISFLKISVVHTIRIFTFALSRASRRTQRNSDPDARYIRNISKAPFHHTLITPYLHQNNILGVFIKITRPLTKRMPHDFLASLRNSCVSSPISRTQLWPAAMGTTWNMAEEVII